MAEQVTETVQRLQNWEDHGALEPQVKRAILEQIRYLEQNDGVDLQFISWETDDLTGGLVLGTADTELHVFYARFTTGSGTTYVKLYNDATDDSVDGDARVVQPVDSTNSSALIVYPIGSNFADGLLVTGHDTAFGNTDATNARGFVIIRA